MSDSASNPVVGRLPQSKQNKYTCIGCRIKLDSAELQRSHFKTDWHLYNLKRKICELDPIDLDSYNAIQAVVPMKEEDQLSILIGSTYVDLGLKSELQKTSDGESVDFTFNEDDEVDEDWEKIEKDEISCEEFDIDEIEELLSKIIGPNSCLFCDIKSSNIKNNIDHMNKVHGFFIPEERYLIDRDGLLDYLGFKVGAGATCLWCNRQFTSTHGVKLHMLYKDHCKIFYDQDASIKEFREFYDYSTQKQIEMKPLNQLVVVKKRFEKKSDKSSLMKCSSTNNQFNHELDLGTRNLISCRDKSRKRFEVYQAKIHLRTTNANNNTLRARLRQRNPI